MKKMQWRLGDSTMPIVSLRTRSMSNIRRWFLPLSTQN
jgi:hypothetical protein